MIRRSIVCTSSLTVDEPDLLLADSGIRTFDNVASSVKTTSKLRPEFAEINSALSRKVVSSCLDIIRNGVSVTWDVVGVDDDAMANLVNAQPRNERGTEGTGKQLTTSTDDDGDGNNNDVTTDDDNNGDDFVELLLKLLMRAGVSFKLVTLTQVTSFPLSLSASSLPSERVVLIFLSVIPISFNACCHEGILVIAFVKMSAAILSVPSWYKL